MGSTGHTSPARTALLKQDASSSNKNAPSQPRKTEADARLKLVIARDLGLVSCPRPILASTGSVVKLEKP